ncbi:MAG TPA: hypothetical protein VGI33_12790 [Paenibacillus sp.]|jgi:hypothetical protein
MKQYLRAMLLLVLVVGGCTPATKISTDQVKAFVKDVKNSTASVKDMDVQFRPTQIEIIYTLNENIDETDRMDLLSGTKQLVNSDKFDQEVIQEDYLKKYESGGYPDIAIIFDANDDGEYDYQYTSSYDEGELNTTDEPSYSEWYYHQDMSATGELVPLE